MSNTPEKPKHIFLKKKDENLTSLIKETTLRTGSMEARMEEAGKPLYLMRYE